MKSLMFKIVPIFVLCLACVSCEEPVAPKMYTIIIPPFRNVENSKTHEYVGVGIADELSRKLSYSRYIRVIDMRYLVNRIQLDMLVSAEGDGIDKMLSEFEKSNETVDYVVDGRFKVYGDGKLLDIQAAVLVPLGRQKIAEDSRKGQLKDWGAMRGLMAIELARQLKVPLSDAELQLLKELETSNLVAFQDNYTGKIYELRSQNLRDQQELDRMRNLAMHYYAKAILEDAQYMAVRQNYRGTFDFQKFVSTREEKKDRVQGRLNELSIFGLKQDDVAGRNIDDWMVRNGGMVSAMVNGLADEYILEVQGHSDVMGYPQQLQEISENRARIVAEKLRAAGVFSDKIRYKGFGATRLIPWIEPGHESNNRVTFEIVTINN